MNSNSYARPAAALRDSSAAAEVLSMDINDSPAPASYLDGIRAYKPLIGINDKFTQVLAVTDSDLAELFVEPGQGAEYLLEAMTLVRNRLTEIEAFLREGILLTGPES